MSKFVRFKCPGCNLVITTDKFELHVMKFCADPFKAKREAAKTVHLIMSGTKADTMEGLRRIDAAKIQDSL